MNDKGLLIEKNKYANNRVYTFNSAAILAILLLDLAKQFYEY